PACDVYALGGVLSFALTGRAPFTGPSLWNVLDQVLHEPPPELSAGCPGASPELSALVTRALAKDPAERPSARELADALAEGGRLGARERRGARASGRVAGLLVVGLALLSGAALSTRSPGAQPAPGASVAGSAATRAPRSEGPELAELRRQLESPDALAAGVAAAALHEEGQVLPGVGRALRVLAGGIQLTDAYPGDIPEIAFDARPDRAWLFLHHDGTLVAWDLAAGSAPRWTLKSGEALQPPRHLANRLSAGRGRLLFQCRESSESGVGHETVLVELGEALVEPEFLPPRANGFAGHKKGMYSALSPDGQRVALISRNDGKLLVYDAAGRQLAAGEALTGTIRSFEFGPEGLDLYAHYHRVVEEERRRGHLLRFDLRRGAARAELITSSTSPSLAVGGGRVALSHGNLVTLCRFDLSEPRHFLFPSELAEGAGLSQWLSARVCLDPRRPRLYGMCSRTRMEGKEGVFECWDLEQRVALWTRRIPAGARNPTLSPDGRWLVWLREHDLAGREAHDLRLFYVGPLPGSGHSLSSRPLKELAKDALPLDSNEKR
ncbi:MAG TPA: hypothetical protein DEA08_38585, partial [Planctomycetes bacterium]|nr:hypothetical protein [Planctomycetota bacterium]